MFSIIRPGGVPCKDPVFLPGYKKLTLMWISRHRGAPLGAEILVDHWPIPLEKVHEKIAYLHRNPIAAGFRQVPYFYRWSSASLLFAARPDIVEGMTMASQFSAAKKRKALFNQSRHPGQLAYRQGRHGLAGLFCGYPAGRKTVPICRKLYVRYEQWPYR